MLYFMIAILVLIFLVGVSCSFKNKELKLDNEPKQKEYSEKLQADKNTAMNSIEYNEITPEIIEVYYNNKSTYRFSNKDWRRIKKGKISYFDENETCFLFESYPFYVRLVYNANDRVCIQWHVNMQSKEVDGLGSNFHLCTMYIGEGAIQEFEDEIERVKIEERLRKAKRKKELEREVKRKLEQENRY